MCTAKIFRSRKVELIHLISRAKETFYEEDVRNIRVRLDSSRLDSSSCMICDVISQTFHIITHFRKMWVGWMFCLLLEFL